MSSSGQFSPDDSRMYTMKRWRRARRDGSECRFSECMNDHTVDVNQAIIEGGAFWPAMEGGLTQPMLDAVSLSQAAGLSQGALDELSVAVQGNFASSPLSSELRGLTRARSFGACPGVVRKPADDGAVFAEVVSEPPPLPAFERCREDVQKLLGGVSAEAMSSMEVWKDILSGDSHRVCARLRHWALEHRLYIKTTPDDSGLTTCHRGMCTIVGEWRLVRETFARSLSAAPQQET